MSAERAGSCLEERVRYYLDFLNRRAEDTNPSAAARLDDRNPNEISDDQAFRRSSMLPIPKLAMFNYAVQRCAKTVVSVAFFSFATVVAHSKDFRQPGAWLQRAAGDVALIAPFELASAAAIEAQLPAQAKAMLQSFTVYEGKSAPTFRVGITRATYKSHIRVDLDKGASTAIRQLAATVGDPQPAFTITPTKLDGLEARRVSYTGNGEGRPVRVAALFVQRGQTTWQIQVLYSAEIDTPNAERILSSLVIIGAP